MTTPRTTWPAQIAVVLVLLASGMASGASGFLSWNSPLGENAAEGGFRQAAVTLSGEAYRGWGDLKGQDAADFFVAPVRPAGYTRMQDYIPHLDNPATAATTRLTAEQAFALQENLAAIGNRTVPAVRANIQGGRAVADATQGLQGQLNLPRFRFIDQVPGGRAAIDAILREFPNLTFPH